AGIAYPDRQVIAMVGDGGFTMTMGEMATLGEYKLPVKVVVFKNNTLGMIKWEQMVLEGNPQVGGDLQPIEFAGEPPGCGAAGYPVDDRAGAEDVLREALSQPGPALVEAVIDPTEPPLPGHITLDQAFHFAEALARGQKDRWGIIKTVLENKVREVV